MERNQEGIKNELKIIRIIKSCKTILDLISEEEIRNEEEALMGLNPTFVTPTAIRINLQPYTEIPFSG